MKPTETIVIAQYCECRFLGTHALGNLVTLLPMAQSKGSDRRVTVMWPECVLPAIKRHKDSNRLEVANG